MNDVASRHPKAITMAAFIEGTLSPAEVREVATHLRDCGDCRTVVAETARFEREEGLDEAEPAAPTHRRWWLAAAAVLALFAVGAPLAMRWTRMRSSTIAHMIAAAPEHRFVEARLSGFPYGRLQPPTRGEAPPDPADLKLSGAAGDVLENTRDRGDDAMALHASGVAYLLVGRPNESIAALERAARQSKDARAWSDLAAARHARAVNDEHPSELAQALADADRALRIDPRLPEAQFNRALILETLGLRDEARQAWETYLALDPGSGWSNEARAHLRRLATTTSRFDARQLVAAPEATVRAFPQESRGWVEGPMLAAWADAVAAHDEARATTLLHEARVVADAIARIHGDFLALDVVNGDPRIASALRLYRDARVDYSARRPQKAEAGFRQAARLFADANSPMANVASFYAASTAFDQNRAEESRTELLALLERVDATRHRGLAAQIHRQLVVLANAAGDWGASIREADASAALFRSIGERSNEALVSGFGAMAAEVIGERDAAWRQRVLAFSLFSATGERARIDTILHNCALTLSAIDRGDAALSFLALLTNETGGRDDAARLSWAEADAARLAARNEDVERAAQSLASAQAWSGRVEDAALRESVRAQIDLAEATMRTKSGTATAIALLDRSIAFFQGSNRATDAADAYLQRARAHRASGDGDAALADYGAALREIERQRDSIANGESRLRYLDTAGAVVDETIDLRIERGDAAGAFHVADRSRALLDSSVAAIATSAIAIPPQVALIEYAVLPRSLVSFCAARGAVMAARTNIDRHVLEARVESLAERIRRRENAASIDRETAALHRLLIEPLRSCIGGLDELVIVPDRQLHGVPFAALRDARTGRLLIEEFVLRFAPSARFRRDAGGELAPALVIADPRSNLGPRLPGSRDEATQVAGLYGATLLAGEAATRAAFLDGVQRSSLIHFAGHANSDAGSSYGALMLASSAGDSGVVGASDVARLRLEREPLVILAACGTFRGNALHVAGMSSLSRAFLLAGARGVVGTLWEIDDDTAAALFLRIHQRLRAGLPPARALRDAQLDLLRSGDPRLSHPAAWAPVAYLSGA